MWDSSDDWPTGNRARARDFDTLKAAGNTHPGAIWSDGKTMWVRNTHHANNKLYAYHLGTGGVVGLTPDQYDRYRNTWTATDGPSGLTDGDFRMSPLATFKNHRIRPGTTMVRAIHFTELRTRIDTLRSDAGLGRFGWTDPVVTAGVTPVRLVHLQELRAALDAVYDVRGRLQPGYTDATVTAGATVIRAVHLTELRAAVAALE